MSQREFQITYTLTFFTSSIHVTSAFLHHRIAFRRRIFSISDQTNAPIPSIRWGYSPLVVWDINNLLIFFVPCLHFSHSVAIKNSHLHLLSGPVCPTARRLFFYLFLFPQFFFFFFIWFLNLGGLYFYIYIHTYIPLLLDLHCFSPHVSAAA